MHTEFQASNGTWHRVEDIVPNNWYEPGEVYPGNTSEVYEHWYIGRNYELFGILAGVRDYAGPIVEPKGLPHDVGESVKELWDDGSWGHTPHYYYLTDLEANIDRFQDPDYYCQDFLVTISRMRSVADEELEGDGTKIRICFWFDS